MKTWTDRLPQRPLRLFAAAALLAIAGAAVQAAPPPDAMGGPMAMMGGRGFTRMLDAANASADQRSQIKAIMDAAHADLRAIRQAGQPLHQQMMQLFTQANVDANAVEAVRQQMQAQQEQASKRMLQAMIDASRVLTPDQRQQIATAMQQHHAAMQQRWQQRQAPAATK